MSEFGHPIFMPVFSQSSSGGSVGMPDYENGVDYYYSAKSVNSYTMPDNGYLAYSLSLVSESYPTNCYLQINGKFVLRSSVINSHNGAYGYSGIIPVRKNDIITILSAYGSESPGLFILKFYPIKK